MCDSCEVLNINGCNCHEVGCPDAWKDEIRKCRWCGQDFKPEDSEQIYCTEECREAFFD